jgi:dihydroxyacetone kinase
MELAIVARRALAVLEGQGLVVERAYTGTFLSALEMAGVSLSVLRLDDARLARLDATTDAPAWPKVAPRKPRPPRPMPEPTRSEGPRPASPPVTELGRALGQAIRAAAEALIIAEPRLTEMDRFVGDGDLGISLARGARAALAALASCPLDDPAATLHALGLTVQSAIGGTSGALYGIFFLRAAARLRTGPADDPRAWADALLAGSEAISELGGAKPGDRTMLDALVPALNAFFTSLDANQPLEQAVLNAASAAAVGANTTAMMPPRRGRSSYIGARVLGHPDPGAEAVAVWLGAIAESRSESRNHALNPRFEISNSKFEISNSRSDISHSRSENSKSRSENLKYEIPNLKYEIPYLKFEIEI